MAKHTIPFTEHQPLLHSLHRMYGEVFYFVFRILVGFLFLSHGLQKFGAFGSTPASVGSLFGVAGIVEILAGLALIVGLFTRLAAMGSALLMLIAYFMVHAPQGVLPLLNKGEPALLFFAAFLILMMYGAGRGSLERLLFHREFF